MHKKVGALLSFLFISLAFITYIFNGGFLRYNVLGVFVIGLLYMISIFNHSFFKGYQIALTILLGCVSLGLNDVNSMVSLVVFSLVLPMCHKYFKKIKWLGYTMIIPFITTAIIVGWSMINISLTLLIFMAYTTVMYIIQNDKV